MANHDWYLFTPTKAGIGDVQTCSFAPMQCCSEIYWKGVYEYMCGLGRVNVERRIPPEGKSSTKRPFLTEMNEG